jgi:hypothetical protein
MSSQLFNNKEQQTAKKGSYSVFKDQDLTVICAGENNLSINAIFD